MRMSGITGNFRVNHSLRMALCLVMGLSFVGVGEAIFLVVSLETDERSKY